VDVIVGQWVRWFRGLTCEFWAENGIKKSGAETMAMESVASRFSYVFGLGKAVAGSELDPGWAEATGYGKTSARYWFGERWR